MRCHNCGAELEDGVRFCRECGAKVAVIRKRFCRECGAPIREGDSFCSGCGARLEPEYGDYNDSEPDIEYYTESDDTFLDEDYNDDDIYFEEEPVTRTSPPNSSPQVLQDLKDSFRQVADQYRESLYRKKRPSKKDNRVILLIIELTALIIVVSALGLATGSCGASDQNDKNTSSSAASEVGTVTNYSIPKGSQYAYMSDEWNVYIATAVTDSIIKIEHWDKTLVSTKTMSYSEDIGTFKINDPENGFTWIGDSKYAFTFSFDDRNNSSVKKSKPGIFTINISDDDTFKGTDYSEDITCYSYTCDDWHKYRAIPLTDDLMKIECWSRSSSLGSFCFGWDWCVIDTKNNELGFEWTDDDHTSFMITAQDKQNKFYWKDESLVLFESENESPKFRTVEMFLSGNNGQTVTAVSTSVVSENESGHPQRDGFSSTQVVRIGNYDVEVPDYWKPTGDSTEEHFMAQAETDGKSVILMLNAFTDGEMPAGQDAIDTEPERDALIQDFIVGMQETSGLSDVSVTGKSIHETDIFSCPLWNLKFKLQEYSCSGSVLLFPSVEDNQWITITLLCSDNADYRYDNDYLKIIDSVHRHSEAEKTTQDKKDTTSKDEKEEALAPVEMAQPQEPDTGDNTMPILNGTSIDEIMMAGKEFALAAPFEDEDFGHGTKSRSLWNQDNSLSLDFVYSTKTKEILYAEIITFASASRDTQYSFIQRMAKVLCPKESAEQVNAWVSKNIGSEAITTIDGIEYELSFGPANNALFSVDRTRWEEWDYSFY